MIIILTITILATGSVLAQNIPTASAPYPNDPYLTDLRYYGQTVGCFGRYNRHFYQYQSEPILVPNPYPNQDPQNPLPPQQPTNPGYYYQPKPSREYYQQNFGRGCWNW